MECMQVKRSLRNVNGLKIETVTEVNKIYDFYINRFKKSS